RLGSVLKGYGVPVSGDLGPFSPALLEERPAGAARVTVGALSAGFVLATEALAIVTEEEVFGTRARRRRTEKGKRDKARGRAFLEDLRQLEVGDYVVHADHGVGRYLGIERKS